MYNKRRILRWIVASALFMMVGLPVYAQSDLDKGGVFRGIPWGATFSQVSASFPEAETLDTSLADYCKGSPLPQCRMYQVILKDHPVGTLSFKVIFIFSEKAKLNGINFYYSEPEKESISSMRVNYLKVADLISQKYGNPLSVADFKASETSPGSWYAAGKTTWMTKSSLIEINARMYAKSLEIPPYEKSSALFLMMYRPLQEALDNL